jgi:hypothetical protein
MAELVRYQTLKSALAAALTLDEVKDIRDQAEAMRAYAHMANDLQLELDAGEIRVRAERKLGELLIAAKKSGSFREGAPAGRTVDALDSSKRTVDALDSSKRTVDALDSSERMYLRDLNITRNLSSDAQMLAAVPEHTFEEIITAKRAARQARKRVTLNIRKKRSATTPLQRVEKLLPQLSDTEWDVMRQREDQRRRKAHLTLVEN